MSDDTLSLSIVVPAYNEAVRIRDRAGLLNEAVAAGDIDPLATELIIVDDGSTDETARLAERLLAPTYPRLRILQLNKNSGKGAAIRVGAGAAMTDSTTESHSRHRVIMGRTFNFLANAVTNVGLKDTQCGFKAFRTPVARILFHLMVIDRFAFDVEVLSLARQLGMEICEVPVEWRDSQNSTVRPLTDSMSMAIDVLRIRWRKKRPHIPALMVGTNGSELEAAENEFNHGAFSSFRQTDPIFRLTEDRALVLLPLCKPDEVDGAAARLRQPSTNLTVSKRLVSCDELMAMMPIAFEVGRGVNTTGGSGGGKDRSERRHVSRSAGHVRHYPRVDAQPMSLLEA
jgi:dolichyl-phosphate beta-glucosyltransferase